MQKNKFIRSLALLIGITLLAVISVVWVSCEKKAETITSPIQNRPTEFNVSEQAQKIEAVMKIQDKHTAEMLKVDGVVGTATTLLPTGEVAIKIYTQKQGLQKMVPASLEQIPVVVEYVGEIKAHQKEYIRPVPGGVSGHNIGNRPPGNNSAVCFMGTIGCIVKKGSSFYLLSNNHVFARANRAALGEPIVQPSPGDHPIVCTQDENHIVAELTAFKKINWIHTKKTNVIDAAIAKILPGIEFDCEMFCDYTPSSVPATPYLGMEVKLCGRTSGLSYGQVNALNATIIVSYDPDGTAVFENQVGFTKIASGGDSGSLIVTADGNQPVALEFAGGATASFGNPIQEVLNYFGVKVCGD